VLSEESKDINVYDAYRPTTFYSIIAWLIALAVIIYVFLARSLVSLVLLIVPMWMYSYVQKKMKPLYNSRFSLEKKKLYIVFPQIPKIEKALSGRLSIIHETGRPGENISIEFIEAGSVKPKLETPKTIILPWIDKGMYAGARIDPTVLTVLFEHAYKLKVNGQTVYIGSISPPNLEIAENGIGDVRLEKGVLEIKLPNDVQVPVNIYSYSKCCGFESKHVLVGRIENLETRLSVKLGVPENKGVAVIPDKPFLPSLLGGLLSDIGYPVSYLASHPDAELIVEAEDSNGWRRSVIIKPVLSKPG
jgi:hypothetical protein